MSCGLLPAARGGAAIKGAERQEATGLVLQQLVALLFFELLDCAGRALVVIAGRRSCGAAG